MSVFVAVGVTNFLVKICSYLPKRKILSKILFFSKKAAFQLRLNFKRYFFMYRKEIALNKVFLQIKKRKKEI